MESLLKFGQGRGRSIDSLERGDNDRCGQHLKSQHIHRKKPPYGKCAQLNQPFSQEAATSQDLRAAIFISL